MESKKLQIGNSFKDAFTGKIIKVLELTEKNIVFSGNFKGIWQAKPISINSQILKDLGYKEINESQFQNDLFIIEEFLYEYSIRKRVNENESVFLLKIDWLHEIENIHNIFNI